MRVRIRVKKNKSAVAGVATPADISTPIIDTQPVDTAFTEGF